jgi:hypothetical protein
MMHYTTIDLLVLESSAKNTQDVLISELVVSVQDFDGICLREVGDRVRQNNIDYEKCEIVFDVMHVFFVVDSFFDVMHVFSDNTLSPTRFSLGSVFSHRREVCPWQQICKTHLCRFKSAS